MIQFEGIKKRFKNNLIYEGLDLSIARGETMVVVGGSGSGKTVLLKLLIGLMKPDAGRVVFDGIDVAPLDDAKLLPIRKRISILFQSGALFDSLSVADNVAYPLREHSKLTEEQIARRVREKLALVGLESELLKAPSELSGGMRKRVALARAIAGDPEVLLYDEPTTGLDPPNTRRISELIRSIQEKMHVTSIVVTHDLASAFFVADRVALLANRRIEAVLTPAEFQASENELIREFMRGSLMLPSQSQPQGTPAQASRELR